MTVFKGYLLVIRRNLGTIIMYIAIFVGVAGMIQASYGSTKGLQGFTSVKLDVAVLDRDGGVLADALRQLLAREQNVKEIEDDQQVIQDELYYRNVEYVLVIPEGIENLVKDGEKGIQNITVPNSVMGFYVDQQVNMLLNQIRVYLACGYSMEESCEKALSLGAKEASVELLDVNGNAGIRPDYNYYFGYMPYAFLGAIIMAMSLVIMEFKKKEVRRRMQSSAVPFRRQNLAAIASFLVIGGGIWLICMAIQTVLYRGGIFRDSNAGYYLLNSLVCMLVALSLGYISGMAAGSPVALSGINNVVSLGLCFLGGIFVPLEMLGGAVGKIAQFLPTYWYSTINGILGDYEVLGVEMRRTIWQGLGIQALFAAACFGIALAIRRMQTQEKE